MKCTRLISRNEPLRDPPLLLGRPACLLQVFSIHAYNTTEFKPAVSVEEAERRYKHWQKAVHRSLDLADLAE